jgi:hypothetical protein
MSERGSTLWWHQTWLAGKSYMYIYINNQCENPGKYRSHIFEILYTWSFIAGQIIEVNGKISSDVSSPEGFPQDDRDEIVELLVDFQRKMSGPHLLQAGADVNSRSLEIP